MGEWNYDKILTNQQKEHLKKIVRNDLKNKDIDYCSCGSEEVLGRNYIYNSEKYKDTFSCKKCLQELSEAIKYDYLKEYVKNKIEKYVCSKKTRVDFNIDTGYLVNMLMLAGPVCPYFLCEIDITTAWKLHLDRFDNERGYEKGNVIWCLPRANRIKSDLTIDELKIYNHVFYERGLKYLKDIKENI